MNERLYRLAWVGTLTLAAVLLWADSAQAQRRFRRRGGLFGGDYAPPAGLAPGFPGPRLSFYPPPAGGPAPAGGRVSFNVLLPAPDAQLWVDGVPTTSKGTARLLESPPLPDGRRYTYTFTAKWQQGDRPFEERRQVSCYAGDRLTLNFTRPDPRGAAAEIVPREIPDPNPKP